MNESLTIAIVMRSARIANQFSLIVVPPGGAENQKDYQLTRSDLLRLQSRIGEALEDG